MIKTVIRLQNDLVMVFDESGEEIPEYQGYYHNVKDKIITDCTATSVFYHWFGFAMKPYEVKMEDW